MKIMLYYNIIWDAESCSLSQNLADFSQVIVGFIFVLDILLCNDRDTFFTRQHNYVVLVLFITLALHVSTEVGHYQVRFL
jgi:hypothetical protein